MKKQRGFKSVYAKLAVIFIGIWWLVHILNFGAVMRIMTGHPAIERILAGFPVLLHEFALIRRLTGLSFIFSVITGTVLILVAAHSIVRPIRAISKASRQIAGGNFDIDLPVAGRDEISRLTADFNQMARSLQGIDHLRQDFVANVSHEFKTPITAIKGYAELIRDGGLSESQAREYASLIASESHRLSELAANLLRLSELDSHLVREQAARFRLDEQLRRSILVLQIQWQKKALDLDIDLEPVPILAPEHLLEEVWLNLLDNAVRFSPNNGKIVIRLTQHEKQAHVAIADQGAGISALDQPRIFERFFKSDVSRSDPGTGLGLVIVKKILENLGGEISFESKPGQGTTFFVSLPLHED